MKSATIRTMQVLALAAAIASATSATLAQPPAPPQTAAPAVSTQTTPAAQTSFCGSQALCYETTDFAATITQFRTSVDERYGVKVLDAIMHFQNKTNQLLSLGYVDQSASGLDDQGNRYSLNAYNGGVRGIGVVAGNNMDPKFTLQPGGAGDARFEWLFRPGQGVVVGVNYELELSIREINRVEGNQWVLGGETLLHYQGLVNGVGVTPVSYAGTTGVVPAPAAGAPAASGGMAAVSTGMATTSSVRSALVPGQTAGSTTSGQPCPPGTSASKITNVANAAGQQNATANNAVTNATSAISSLSSIFGHKKPAAAPANTAGATPCVATTNTTVRQGATTTPVAYGVTQQPAGTAAPASAATPLTKAAAAQRTPVTASKTATTQPPTAVTKAALKQPVTAPNAAKTPATPATATPAKRKPATTTPATSSGGAL